MRFEKLRSWAKAVKRDVIALWIAARDARTPWHAKAVAIIVAAYALSPIDLIPDFIPIIGYLDDILLVPLGILLAIWLIPASLMVEFRKKADELEKRPVSRIAAVLVVLAWVICGLWLVHWYLNYNA